MSLKKSQNGIEKDKFRTGKDQMISQLKRLSKKYIYYYYNTIERVVDSFLLLLVPLPETNTDD